MKACGEEEVEFCSFIRDTSWRLAVNFTPWSRFITGKRFPDTSSKLSKLLLLAINLFLSVYKWPFCLPEQYRFFKNNAKANIRIQEEGSCRTGKRRNLHDVHIRVCTLLFTKR